MLMSMTINFSGTNALESIASSRVGRSRDWPTKKFCGVASNASTHSTHFYNGDERDSAEQLQFGRSNALVARSIFIFSVSRLRQHRRPGGADHDDVQPHGGKAPLVIQRSLRQNHGFLPHASRPGGIAAGDLRWLSQKEILGWDSRRSYVHCAWRSSHDSSQLAVR